MLWVIVAFVLFQILGGIITVVLLVSTQQGEVDFSALLGELSTNLDLLFIGNSTGQIVILGLVTWLIAKALFGANRSEALRLKAGNNLVSATLLALALIVFVQPMVVFLGWINLQIPFSEGYLEFERAQNELLESYLRSDHFLPLTLVHVALVPAFCEELLMRGFLLRSFEKIAGIFGALMLSSLIFGFFHVKLTQVIPLSALGMVLAFITWKTNSIWPAVAAHFLNNAANVVMARWFPEIIFDEFTPEKPPEIWLVLVSFALCSGIVFLIAKQSKNNVFQTQ